MSEAAIRHEIVGDWSGQLVATAIHAGHELRPAIAGAMVLDEQTRLREEDPFTDRIAGRLRARVLVHRSRFEVDLNRARDDAVYRVPEDSWGLDVWRESPLAPDLTEVSLTAYDDFYADLGRRLDEVAARGPFVVYDVHSYNHRRPGADQPEEPAEDNPEVNVGTGTLDRTAFAPVVDAFADALRAFPLADGHDIDVRENVKFQGAQLCRWIHDRYPGIGCGLALEFKKTFMDEWTGEPDQARIAELARALESTGEPVLAALRRIG